MRKSQTKSLRVLSTRSAQPKNRNRRLFFEQFEDRRMLAQAYDDSYEVEVNGSFSGNALEYDSFNASWPDGNNYCDDVWIGQSTECEGNFVEGTAYAESGFSPEPPERLSGGPGGFTYTPSPGVTGIESFSYFIRDDVSESWATVTFTVMPPNIPPESTNDSHSTSEDTQLVVAAPGVLATDSDAEEASLTAWVVANATHGFVSLNPDGGFSYTPYSNYNGADSFTYWAWDGHHYGNIATVSLSVTPVNDAPVAANDTFIIIKGTPRWIDVLANDSDVEGSALSVTNPSNPPNGSVNVFADGTIEYLPDAGYVGLDSFTYEVSDGQAPNGTATVNIEVRDPNTPELIENFGSAPPAIVFNGMAYFCRGLNGNYDIATLWKSDGTSEGTSAIGGSFNAFPWPGSFTGVGGTLFFTANDGVNGHELWKTDGTESGTVLLKDIRSGSSGSRPYNLTNVNGILYFSANDGTHGYELWKSDGTEASTIMVKDVASGAAHGASTNWHSIANVNGNLFFAGTDDPTARQLWKSDGTPSNTVLVKNLGSVSAVSAPMNFTSFNGSLFFTAGGKLMKSNGTAAGTELVKGFPVGGSYLNETVYELTPAGNNLFFSAYSTASGQAVWVTNGNPTETFSLKNTLPQFLTNVNGTLFFRANAGTTNVGEELWKSDGTANGTILVKDIRAGVNGSNPMWLTAVNSKLFFAANDGVKGLELWTSDGTANGTNMAMDFAPGAGSSWMIEGVNLNGSFFFTASEGYNPQILIVRAINHPPAGTNKTITMPAQSFYTLAVNDFGFSDPADVPPHAFKAAKITKLPAVGALTIDGSAVTPGQSIPVADISTGKLRYAPPIGSFGNNLANFMFHVQDNGGTKGSDFDPSPNTITFNVTAPNQPPSGANKLLTLSKNSTHTFLTNDFGFSDENASPPNAFAAVIITTLPSAGSLTINSVAVALGQSIAVSAITAGNLKYVTPANTFGDNLANFSFQVKDNGGTANGGIDIDPTPNTITVSVTNSVPSAYDDLYVFDRTETPSLTIPPRGVLLNDMDADNDPLFAFPDDQHDVTKGDLVLGVNGGFTYTPDSDFSYGIDTFMYYSSDLATLDPATVTIRVDRRPVSNNDSYVTTPGVAINITNADSGVRFNDTDGDNDPLTIVAVSGLSSGTVGTPVTTAHGTVTLHADGRFLYTPTGGYHGFDSFTYKTSDGYLDSTPATVTLIVDNAPVANFNSTTDSYSVSHRSSITIYDEDGVLHNDTDADGDVLHAFVVTAPLHGQLDWNSTNKGGFTYSPNNNTYLGPDSFTYKVTDGFLERTATVNITITNTPPSTASSTTMGAWIYTHMNTTKDGNLLFWAVDADGDPLTVVACLNAPAGLTCNVNDATYHYEPPTDFTGEVGFTLRLFDGFTEGDGVVKIHVAPISHNDTFEFLLLTSTLTRTDGSNDSGWTNFESSSVLFNDEGDHMEIAGPLYPTVSLVSGATLVFNPSNGTFTYTPDSNRADPFVGEDIFAYFVTSNGINSTTASILKINVRQN